MIRVLTNNNGKVQYIYNSKTGVKSEVVDYIKPLFKETNSNNGGFNNLTGETTYIRDNTNGTIYPYEVFNTSGDYDKGIYFNTLLTVPNNVLEALEFPKIVFYDIETGSESLPITDTLNNGVSYLKAPSTAVINSIAWIDDTTGEEFCLIRDRDGSEYDILDKFVTYLTDNDVMGLVGHNNYNFDDILLRDRLLHYKLDHKLFSKKSSQCNLDTLVLAQLFNRVSKNKMISLNDLATLLNLNTSKIDLEVLNPISAYEKAVKNNDFTTLEEYNLQDVRVTRDCFNSMNSKEQLTELFKLSYCPFNKMDKVTQLLNYYTCHKLFNDKIIVPKLENTKINAVNHGGYNYIKDSDELLKYDNVTCYDIVSYYPNLMRLIGADNNAIYDNFDTVTGELKPFNNNITGGVLSNIATELFNSRLETKLAMKKETDTLKKELLHYQQLTKKIIVNGLYGACNTDYYILGSNKIATIITTIGRELLKAVVDKFDTVYAKTDSVFITTSTSEATLEAINNYTTKFLKERFNLNNIDNAGNSIIRFEIDSIISKLILKSKNEYVKVLNDGTVKTKGGSFTGDNKTGFENDLLKFVLNDNFNITDVFKYCDKAIETKPLTYFSKRVKLTSKTPNNSINMGRYYMEEQGIPYNWDFKYNAVRVNDNKYDWILYPNGHKPKFTISKPYVYLLAINYCEKAKLITISERQSLFKDKTLLGTDYSINDYNRNKKKQLEEVYNSSIITLDNIDNCFNCKKLLELYSLISDTKEYIDKDLIKIVPSDTERRPKYNKMKKHLAINRFNNNQHLKEIPSGALCTGNDNISIGTGYNNLCVFDIDGAKGKLNETDNIKLCTYLKDLLVDTGINFIIQETQSGGYHLFFTGDNDFTFNGFKYPTDFFITELAGTDLGTTTIEVLHNKIVPLAPSTTSKGNYKFLNDNYTWKSIFDKPSVETDSKIKDTFLNAGFTYTEPKVTKVYDKVNYSADELISLSEKDIEKVVNACYELYLLAHNKNCKYYITLALGGYMSRYINFDSAEAIADNIITKANTMFKDHEIFYKGLLNNYISDKKEKTGIPTIRNLLKTDSDNTRLNNSLNTITTTIDKGTIPLGEFGGFKQINNTISQGNTKDGYSTKGYFSIKKIELINGFNPKTQELEDDKPTKYNITITSDRFKGNEKVYSNITINELFKKLDNLNLIDLDKDKFKTFIRKFINTCLNKDYVKKITRPYPNGVYVYKNDIIYNLPYINTHNTLNEGMETLKQLINDVFLNKPEYIEILNQSLLSMLNSVFKSLNLANGVNKVLIVCGAGKTLKTFAVLSGLGLYDYNTKFMETSGADTTSAVQRLASEDTLPLGIHDSQLKLADKGTKIMIKAMAFSFESNIIADSQYGNDVNRRDCYRTLLITNNINSTDLEIDKNDGEDRRINVIELNDNFVVTKEQQKSIANLLTTDKYNAPHLKINTISAIGREFIKFIQNELKPYELDSELKTKIMSTDGFILLEKFWDKVNKETNNKYSDLIDLLSTKYVYSDLTVDRSTDVLNALRQNYKETVSNGEYKSDNATTKWIDSSTLFEKPKDNCADKYKNIIAVKEKEFKNITKSIATNKDSEYLFKSLFINNDTETLPDGVDCNDGGNLFYKHNLTKHYGINNNTNYCLIDKDLIQKYMLVGE